MTYNAAEQEAIGLCIALEALGDIANGALLELRDVQSIPGETEVYFHTHVHKQLFLIRLLDFAKEGGDKELTGVKGSCLDVLRFACDTKSFDSSGSIDELKQSVDSFSDWINEKISISLYLPTLDINANIEVARLDLLTITGNQSKHNLSRLTGVSKKIHEILEDHGHSVPRASIPFSLDDFQEHLEENYFVYYGTWLAELVNNMRWGLQSYLLPTYQASHKTKSTGFGYFYEYPAEIQNDVAKKWYWRLMNNIRTSPFLKKFVAAHYLRDHSSIG